MHAAPADRASNNVVSAFPIRSSDMFSLISLIINSGMRYVNGESEFDLR